MVKPYYGGKTGTIITALVNREILEERKSNHLLYGEGYLRTLFLKEIS